jgi:glycosyltransferase involved in cell wall biosynthesis
VAEKAAQSKINERIYCQISKWLKEAELLIVFGEGDAQALKSSFVNCDQINPQIILFGIDEKFWTPGNVNISNDEGYILSVGSDSLRDYPLLLKAIGDQPLRIVTRQTLPLDLLKPTITIKSDLDWVELREWYRGSKFVVIPIKNEPRNSGHSATLQGMACGKAVILSETHGLWDRERMKHLETCYLVKPENVEALKEAIIFLLAHPDEASRIGENARKLVEHHYSSKKHGELLREYALSLP